MKLDNILFIYHDDSFESMIDYLKRCIADELCLKVDEVGFKDISTPDNVVTDEEGFEFVYDGETNGIVRISCGELTGKHICIEAENSWDAVELYKLINQWLENLDNVQA